MKNRKGITLIALVVTIIILLLLAGITMSVVLGPDKLLEKAKHSRIASRYATIIDKAKVRETALTVAFIKNVEGEHQ